MGKLLTGLVLSSALILGACSNDANEATNANQEVAAEEVKENNETKQQDNDVIVFEVDGEKKEEKLESPYIKGTLAEAVYLPKEFDTKNVNDNKFEAMGTGEYEDFLFSVAREENAKDLEFEIFVMKRNASIQFGDKKTVVTEIDLEKHPVLKEKYDYVIKSELGIGNKFSALKVNNGERIVVSVMIKNQDKLNYGEFALELLRKVELPEPA
ncbi:hypothetical protein [Guptibacillus hwajinpoensis]|uniref:hypothetical protein n=1 Tax=Guptibacillus hwajinpoensis TaxID=208199 RepID=UPI003D049CB7